MEEKNLAAVFDGWWASLSIHVPHDNAALLL
jgi:hypothetical protein